MSNLIHSNTLILIYTHEFNKLKRCHQQRASSSTVLSYQVINMNRLLNVSSIQCLFAFLHSLSCSLFTHIQMHSVSLINVNVWVHWKYSSSFLFDLFAQAQWQTLDSLSLYFFHFYLYVLSVFLSHKACIFFFIVVAIVPYLLRLLYSLDSAYATLFRFTYFNLWTLHIITIYICIYAVMHM